MEDKQHLTYGEKEIEFLKSKDKALAKVIGEVGHVHREIIPDMFMALINSIIGQQISTKAQITIWGRFQNMFGPVTPHHIHTLSAEEIQTCGISLKKATYIKEIASNIIDGSLDLAELETMDDAAVCARLSQLKGIGVWTAEMLMIFSMQRTDVLSWDDLGIQRGLRMLYRSHKLTRDMFAKYKKRYSPYATIAGLYLWELSAGKCEGYVDTAPKVKTREKTAVQERQRNTMPAKTAPDADSTKGMKQYTLMGADGSFYQSAEPGLLGGYRRQKIYGRLDCKSANMWIAKGKYVKHRVFFKDEETAIKAGYRPCAVCMPKEYAEWKKKRDSHGDSNS